MCCGASSSIKKTPKKFFQTKKGVNKIQVTRKTIVDGVIFEPGKTYYVDASIAEKLKGSIG